MTDPTTISQIIDQAATRHALTAADITGPSRRADITAARREAAQQLRHTGMSYPEIGRALNRHHTSVMWLTGALDK